MPKKTPTYEAASKKLKALLKSVKQKRTRQKKREFHLSLLIEYFEAEPKRSILTENHRNQFNGALQRARLEPINRHKQLDRDAYNEKKTGIRGASQGIKVFKRLMDESGISKIAKNVQVTKGTKEEDFVLEFGLSVKDVENPPQIKRVRGSKRDKRMSQLRKRFGEFEWKNIDSQKTPPKKPR